MQNTLNLLRCCLGDARDRGKLKANPSDGVRLGRRRDAVTHDPWTYLRPDEQRAFLSCPEIPVEDRFLVAFAMGSGLRESEQWNLHLGDVSTDRGSVVVRYGSNGSRRRGRATGRAQSKGGPTKGGKPRVVPLFGLAREALDRWLEILPSRPNPLGLVWPSPEGCRRSAKAPRNWQKWLKAAGIVTEKREDQMPVRWHGFSGWRRAWLDRIGHFLGSLTKCPHGLR
jgi:integrase